MNQRPSLFAALATLMLTACSQPNSVPSGSGLPQGSPYANGAAYPWSDRLDEPVADPYAAGRAYPWSSARAASTSTLSSQAVNSGVNMLSDLPWTSATSGWGPIERNRSNGEMDMRDGTTLRIDGVSYAKGLGVHADSDVRYALNGQCTTFTAAVGIDDEVGSLGRVTFELVGDGKLLYTSGEVSGVDAAKVVRVPVSGVRELALRVRSGTEAYYVV